MAPLEHVTADVWSIHCEQCGDYRFDTAFAEFMKRVRARRRFDVLSVVTRVAGALRDRERPFIVTLANYERLAGPDSFSSGEAVHSARKCE
jgi:hypothetical protein